MSGLAWRLLTPAHAAGAIAIIQIEGPLAGACAALGLAGLEPGEVRVRDILGIDRGVVVAWSDSCLQLMPHGGVAVVRAVVAELERRGVSAGAAGDAVYPEARDEIEARMLAALARAASPLAVDLLLDQPRRWREGGGSDRARDRALNRLIDPPLVVAVGPPNVGKSTLVNALSRREVSIVADMPGTTRDHVGVALELDGVVLRYVDTPGIDEGALRASGDNRGPLADARGSLEVVAELASAADLVLVCVDATAPAFDVGRADGVIRVNLRSDLGSVPADVRVSALRGEGLVELVGVIRERLVPRAAVADPGPWRFWSLCK